MPGPSEDKQRQPALTVGPASQNKVEVASVAALKQRHAQSHAVWMKYNAPDTGPDGRPVIGEAKLRCIERIQRPSGNLLTSRGGQARLSGRQRLARRRGLLVVRPRSSEPTGSGGLASACTKPGAMATASLAVRVRRQHPVRGLCRIVMPFAGNRASQSIRTLRPRLLRERIHHVGGRHGQALRTTHTCC